MAPGRSLRESARLQTMKPQRTGLHMQSGNVSSESPLWSRMGCSMIHAYMISWLWIPVTVWAAFAQTLRNATQRHLTAELGTLGATLVRFLYGLPFAIIYLVLVLVITGRSPPAANLAWLFWTVVGGGTQIIATALLLRVLALKNFAIGIAYSKTEVVQVALFGFVILGDRLSPFVTGSIAIAAAGVMLVAAPGQGSLLRGFTSPA